MFNIGDLARHGRVSVRMLRHYDRIGLLRPARVDHWTGYRFYEPRQLARLNRIVALKDLGFTLEQVGAIVDDQVDPQELRGMLRLRRAELHEQVAADAARLRQVEARLRIIEGEGAMPTSDIQIKTIPVVRVAEMSATAASLEPTSISPTIRPLFGQLGAQLADVDIQPVGPGIAYYEDGPDGLITVHAAFPVNTDPGGDHGPTIVDLPRIEQAATIVHSGSMDYVMSSIQTLASWIDAHGYVSAGYPREVTLECGDNEDDWVTELQEPIAAA